MLWIYFFFIQQAWNSFQKTPSINNITLHIAYPLSTTFQPNAQFKLTLTFKSDTTIEIVVFKRTALLFKALLREISTYKYKEPPDEHGFTPHLLVKTRTNKHANCVCQLLWMSALTREIVINFPISACSQTRQAATTAIWKVIIKWNYSCCKFVIKWNIAVHLRIWMNLHTNTYSYGNINLVNAKPKCAFHPLHLWIQRICKKCTTMGFINGPAKTRRSFTAP